jgi:hydroxyacid-oxoacid transhydrogenase
MLFAAAAAGIGFGNAGVHLCHGMSYPISGHNTKYKHPGYEVDHPIVPRVPTSFFINCRWCFRSSYST